MCPWGVTNEREGSGGSGIPSGSLTRLEYVRQYGIETMQILPASQGTGSQKAGHVTCDHLVYANIYSGTFW